MAGTSLLASNSIDMRLPITPETKDPALFKELAIIYNALRQLQNGTDKYLDIPPVVKSAPYTIAIVDRGKSIDTNSAVTIPLEDTNLPFPLGATIAITNVSNVTINIIATAGVTLIIAGTTTTGSRTLFGYGVATIRKIALNTWIILGAGVA